MTIQNVVVDGGMGLAVWSTRNPWIPGGGRAACEGWRAGQEYLIREAAALVDPRALIARMDCSELEVGA